MACALKIQRKIFAAADAPTASAAALKLKIAHPAGAKQKILEPSFLQPLLRVLEFLKLKFLKIKISPNPQKAYEF